MPGGMEQRLSLVTLGVRDLAASAAFYERLGWRRARAGGGQIVFFQLGGIALGLFPHDALADDAGVDPATSGFRGVTLSHNTRSREGVDFVLEHASAAGARIVKPAHDAPWGGYFGYFADPDGHLWEVAWNPHFPIDADGNVSVP